MIEQRLQQIESHLRGIESFRQRAIAADDARRVERAEKIIIDLEQQSADWQQRLEQRDDRDKQAHQAEQGQAQAPQRQHIFVVNGDPDFLNTMRSLLQDERFNVTTTNYVPQTFNQIAELQPALLLVHLVIGERAGWDILKRMQDEAVTHEIPVVAASPDAKFLERAHADQERYGTDHFRAVPLDYHQIMAAIDELVGKA
ncbi:MAG TPA: response regulator [Thermomicrobiales bacterium]|jgi:CheY-like chemotaxis protein